MEIVLFTLVAIILYLISDAILKAIEKRKGKLLENRSVIFFVIITVLALSTFNLLQVYGPGLGLLHQSSTEETTTRSVD